MAVEIIFEPHSTSYDNEAHISSGHNDVDLSPLGVEQSGEMGKRHESEHFDAIFCSDLQRSYKSAEIAFGTKFPIRKDARLRECDYGDLTQHPADEVTPEKPKRIREPFPNGESYEQAAARMKSFLQDLLRDYDDKRVMIIGHRATQYGLEHWINGVSLDEIVSAPWEVAARVEIYLGTNLRDRCYHQSMKGYITNIEEKALENTNFREVLYTDERVQLVVMNLLPNEDIGEEVHELDQFFRIEKGEGKAILDGVEHTFTEGFAIVIPKGTRHNIINTSSTESLKLYTLYAPPAHKDHVIHKTKAEGESDTTDHFDGVTSE